MPKAKVYRYGTFIDGNQVKEDQNPSSELPESQEPMERIYRFQGKGQQMEITVKGITYSRYSEENIPIIS
jgi:hypothetical protein